MTHFLLRINQNIFKNVYESQCQIEPQSTDIIFNEMRVLRYHSNESLYCDICYSDSISR